MTASPLALDAQKASVDVEDGVVALVPHGARHADAELESGVRDGCLRDGALLICCQQRQTLVGRIGRTVSLTTAWGTSEEMADKTDYSPVVEEAGEAERRRERRKL